VGALVRNYGDLLGATVTRIRTLGKYLDNRPEADPTAEFPREVFRVERKSGQSRCELQFTLASAMDLRGMKLPRRLVLKNTCTFVYRRYVDAGFVHDSTENACPYRGPACFDAMGNTVAADTDVCGKKLSDCKRRYTQPAAIPFRGFPGVYDVRI
jgi:lambda family phage minor tail protein L